ncbi:MAG: flavodoxin family protein [Pseudomonadota bacterium]
MPRLLFVHHSPSDNTLALRDAAHAAIAAVDDIQLRACDSLSATVDAVMACDAILIGTTENFGGMAGRTKDFFERIYYPCLESTQALPVAIYIRAGQDGAGTVQGIERITTGLRWRLIRPPLVLHGQWDPQFTAQTSELAQTLAAGVAAEIF